MGHSGAFAATRARPSEGPKKMYSVTSQEDEEEESGTGPGWADEGEKARACGMRWPSRTGESLMPILMLLLLCALTVKIRAKDGKELTCSIKINRLEVSKVLLRRTKSQKPWHLPWVVERHDASCSCRHCGLVQNGPSAFYVVCFHGERTATRLITWPQGYQG
jgi:hypothetical protein